MKKTVKTITKTVNETVEVCDTCEQEKDLLINWEWSYSCPRDNCTYDWGDCGFCSAKCFKEGLSKALDSIHSGEGFYSQKFTLTAEGDEYNHAEIDQLLKFLEKFKNSEREG